MARHGSIAEQLADFGKTTPRLEAANDNKPKARYSGTLPALRWLWDNHPELAPAFANALPRPAANWFIDVEPTRQEIRPTVGETIKASQDEDGNTCEQSFKTDANDCIVTMGRLKFLNGKMTEWGSTKKGKKLRPTDRPRSTEGSEKKSRSLRVYLATKPTIAGPMDAKHFHRPLSGEPAIAPMYDPLPGVEAARALLESFGVEGTVSAGQLPYGVTFCPVGVADGAGFLGGVSNPSGNSSSGAVMWEAPTEHRSDATAVIEEVAARGTLKSIGMRLGYSEGYADKAGKAALLEVAGILAKISMKKKSS